MSVLSGIWEHRSGLAGVALVGLATCEKADSKPTNSAAPSSAAHPTEPLLAWQDAEGATHTMRLDGSQP